MAASTSTPGLPTPPDPTALPNPSTPPLARVSNSVRMSIIQAVTSRVLKPPRAYAPTSILSYPSYPLLKHRVYVPPSQTTKTDGEGAGKLPLYIHIHGGGFALMTPAGDDKFCHNFSNENQILVISLDYPKAPSVRYPGAVNSTISAIKSILEDEALMFDRKKVAVGGFSAGGNLSLAAVQDASLQGKIGGVMPIYAPMDFVASTKEKVESRPKGAKKAFLEPLAGVFNWGYIPGGQDLRDPRLSVAFAERETLPRKVYVVGTELDMLCREEEVFANRIAGREIVDGGESGWEEGGVRWEKILRVDHAFDSFPQKKEMKEECERKGKEMYKSMAEWLFKEVYV